VTRLWAAALHRAAPEADGLVWVARAHDQARARVLFGDRVGRADLAPDDAGLPLIVGPGRALVEDAATRAGILIVRRG
jgi:16S rRNA C1402 (ribose-2'-O) methylase RsmI